MGLVLDDLDSKYLSCICVDTFGRQMGIKD